MLEKLFKTELIISENLQKYLDKAISPIDCGKEKCIGDKIIIELEKSRIKNTRESLIALIDTFSGNKLASDSPIHLKNMFPQGNMDSLDLEVMINYTILGTLNLTLDKAQKYQSYCSTKMQNCKGINYEMNSRVNKFAKWYISCLEGLVSQKKQFINELLSNGISSFDFTDPNIISHERKIKLLERKIN